MKTILMLLGVACTAPLIAADADKILVSGNSVSVGATGGDLKASGAAKAIVGEMTVTAETIVFDRGANVLKCEGAVTIRMAENVVTARDCTIALSPGQKRLFSLARENARMEPAPGMRFYPSSQTDLIGPAADREKALQDFRYRYYPGK